MMQINPQCKSPWKLHSCIALVKTIIAKSFWESRVRSKYYAKCLMRGRKKKPKEVRESGQRKGMSQKTNKG
jgi:uncharacterized protein involved in tolerance to divalent cations